MLISAIYVAAIVAVLVLTVIARRNLLYCYVSFVPWLGLHFDVGLTISIDRIFAVGLLVLFFARRNGPLARTPASKRSSYAPACNAFAAMNSLTPKAPC